MTSLASHYPYHKIHCPCAEPIVADADASVGTNGDDKLANDLSLPPSLSSRFALHSLNELYFCDVCMAIRCERCVVEEVVQTYCPACLHVYSLTESTARARRSGADNADSFFCNRNCMQCPLCNTNLMLRQRLPTDGSDVYLECPHCKWDSKSVVGLTKKSSIYQQVRKHANNKSSKFSTLSTFYADLYDALEGTEELESGLSPTHGRVNRSLETTRFLKRHTRESLSLSPSVTLSTIISLGRAGGISKAKSNAYEEREREKFVLELSDDEKEQEEVKRVRALTSFETTSSVWQIISNPVQSEKRAANLLPSPVRLRTRRSKRCRACRHILVRPDVSTKRISGSSSGSSAATVATTFRINLLAKNFIPPLRFTIIPSSSTQSHLPYVSGFIPNVTYTFALTVFNPLYDGIKVTLATPQLTPKHSHRVTILTPAFEVGPNKEDDWDMAALVSLKTKLRAAKVSAGIQGSNPAPNGIFDRGRNWTSVVFEMIPSDNLHAKAKEIEIPLFVSVAYEMDDDQGRKQDNVEKEAAFWSVIRLGKVQQ
ncbi:dynactin subunit 4 [Lipomyces japonicus]|uniref:dynactin subunit 4 n=1 Tax=Lipomyces japonicus TaxID=56871 RepID=UPI0034CE6098